MQRLFGRQVAHQLISVVLNKGRGVHVWDVEGAQYLDFMGAYAAVNQGHCHPKIVATLIKQAQEITLTSRAFHNDALGEFVKFATEYFGYDRMVNRIISLNLPKFVSFSSP